MIDVYDILTIL